MLTNVTDELIADVSEWFSVAADGARMQHLFVQLLAHALPLRVRAEDGTRSADGDRQSPDICAIKHSACTSYILCHRLAADVL